MLSSNLDEAVCISFCANTLRESMNLSVLPPYSRADWVFLLWLGNQSKRRKTEFKTTFLSLKLTLCSILPIVGEVGLYIKNIHSKLKSPEHDTKVHLIMRFHS